MNKKNVQYIIIILIYILLIAGFVALVFYTKTSGTKKVLLCSKLTPKDEVESCEDSIIVTYDPYKTWSEQTDKDILGFHKGVQYDIVIYNKKPYQITNWMLSLTVPDVAFIDSNWNCNIETDIESETTQFIITAQNDLKVNNTIIDGKSSITMGTVVHLRYIPENINDFSLYGVYIYKITDFVLFWVLLGVSLLVVFLTLVQITVSFRMHKFQVQKKRDEALIIQSINTFVNFIDARDPYTKGHSTRVAVYSKELARRMGLSEEDQKTLYFIALMHDVGKISVPDSILLKPGRLTPEEKKIIESHTTIGGSMLRDFTALPGIVSGALYHHERYDGTGYPQGLSGNDIPLFSRIICVADAYDAMSSNRCYRAKLSIEEIMRELTVNNGKQFDPAIVKHMIDMLDEAKITGQLSRFNL